MCNRWQPLLTYTLKIETMIKFTNKTTRLKENKNELLDSNSLFNEQMDEIINDITKKIKPISEKHNAEVTITGNINNLSFNVESENKESANIIENIINSYL